ncbi:unnamed protein product [Symbiodinium sp. CCMP2592]|nr:unnamed protein product [Symbiodinium sp. CCMP2592]
MKLEHMLVFSLFVGALGHGALTKPLPRLVSGQQYCPWCVGEHQPVTNPSGVVNIDAEPTSPCLGSQIGDAPYPASNYNNYRVATAPAEPSYTAGGKLEANVVLDADHNGLAIFDYCPHSEAQTEDCFRSRQINDWTDVHAYWDASNQPGFADSQIHTSDKCQIIGFSNLHTGPFKCMSLEFSVYVISVMYTTHEPVWIQSVPYGMVIGRRQLGYREEVKPEEQTRSWRVPGVPMHWGEQAVKEVLAGAGLTAIALTSRMVRKGKATWFLRARGTEEITQVPVTEGADRLDLFVLPAQVARRQIGQRTPLKPERAQMFTREKFIIQVGSSQTAAMETDGDGKETPVGKRCMTEVRAVPEGVKLETKARDGNCLCHCLGDGLTFLKGDKKKRPASLVRADLHDYMKRKATEFAGWWDGRDTKDQPDTLQTFAAYLDEMIGEGRYLRLLELAAAARAFDLSIVVVPVAASDPPTRHGEGSRTLALWYHGDHYDLLLPEDTTKDYPAVITLATNLEDGAVGDTVGRPGKRKTSQDVAAEGDDDAFTVYSRRAADHLRPRSEGSHAPQKAGAPSQASGASAAKVGKSSSSAVGTEVSKVTLFTMWGGRHVVREPVIAEKMDDEVASQDLQHVVEYYRHSHLQKWHPDKKAQWACFKRWKFAAVLNARDRCEGRQQHGKVAHPGVPKAWRKGPSDKGNYTKATVVRKAAGVAGHIMRRKAGSYGAHDVALHRIRHLGARGKKPRKTAVAYICRRCAAYGASPANFIDKLCQSLEDEHPADLTDGVRAVLHVIDEVKARLQQDRDKLAEEHGAKTHQLKAVAWPFHQGDDINFRVRFLCVRCHFHAIKRHSFRDVECGTLGKRRRFAQEERLLAMT